MAQDDFIIRLTAALERQRSKAQINADIKELERVIRKIKLVGTLAKGETKTILNESIRQMESQVRQLKIKTKVDNRQLNREIDNALRNLSRRDISLNFNGGSLSLQLRRLLAEARQIVERSPINLNVNLKKEKLQNQLTTFLNKNTKINESAYWLKEADRLRTVIGTVTNPEQLRTATDQLAVFTSGVRATGYATISTTDKIKSMLGNVLKIGNYFGLAFVAVNKYRQSLTNLKEMDTILTEISKTTDLTKQKLDELGNSAYSAASKYGVLAKNYMTSVQEMSRAGFGDGKAEPLAELATLAQSAGALTAELANDYLIASNAAYGYKGNVEKLNDLLDAQNQVTNKNAVSMTELADATKVAANQLSNAAISEQEMTALLGTGIATTKESGQVVGRAIKAIVMNLQQVSNTDEGLETTTEDLKKVESGLDSLGIKMKETVDGITTLRNPIQILKELAEVYNSLPDNSVERANIISDVGGKYRGNVLSSILSNWSTYEKMLSDYENATGSALKEAEKTAESWEGRLNQLQNSWDSFVSSITSKDMVKGGISFVDTTIQAFEKLVDTIGALPVLLTTVNASMSALNKNYGITRLFNQNGRVDIQGNFMGLDISAFKAQKAHFNQASIAMSEWNNQLNVGTADIDSFNRTVVQNNTQLKDYLRTTSVDAPASLSGYRSYLNSVGVSTDALRLKTILLTTGMSLLVGFGIQAAIAGISKLVQMVNDQIHAVERAKEALEQARSNFDSVQSELESINTELETNRKRIQELNSLPSLTYVEQGELDKLKEATKELERQKDIKGVELKRSAEELSKKNIETFDKEYGDNNFSLDDVNTLSKEYDNPNFSVVANAELAKKGLEGMIAALIKLQEARKEAEKGDDSDFLGVLVENEQLYKEQLEDNLPVLQSYRDNLNTILDYRDLTAEEQAFYDNLEQGMRLIYQFTDPSAWNQIEFDDIFNAESLETTKEELIELASAGKLDEDTIKQYDKLIEAIAQTDFILSDGETAIQSFIGQIKSLARESASTGKVLQSALTKEQVISNINSLSEGFESLDKLMKSISDKENPFDYSLLDDGKFKDNFSSLGESYTNFIEVISSHPKDIEATQSAFDNLVTTWIDSSGVLENLTEENAELAAAMLHNMGITNAEEVVTSRLIHQHEQLAAEKFYNANASFDLANAEYAEIQAFIDSANAAGVSRGALVELMMTKINCNNTGIVTDGDIQNLIDLANAASIASASVANAKASLDQKNAPGVARSAGAENAIHDSIYNDLSSGIKADLYKPTQYEYSGGTATNKGSKSGGGSKSKSPKSEEMKELDGIKRKVDLLRESYEELNKEASNSDNSYATQLNFLNAAIAKQEDLIALEKEAANVYKLQWETKSAGLSDDVKNTIMQGSMDIEQYSGTQYDSISDALSAWDTYKEMLDSVKSDEREIAIAQRDHFQKQIDWDKQEIDNLKDKSDIAQTTYENQIDYINQALTKSDELSNKLSQKANQATEKWLEAKKVIESIDVAKILRGELNISDYSDEDYIQKLLDAQDAYDDYEDAEEQLNEQVKSNAELQKEAYDKAIEYIESQQNLLSSTNSTIQSDIDLIKEMGGVVTADLYNNMISNNNDLMDLYEEQRAEAKDYLSELDEDSPEYYDVLAQIESCNQAIIQCKAEQAKWNEEIKRLPVERLSKYLSMLGYIKQDLQNFIDEQSSLDIATTKDQYQGLIDISQKQIDKLLEQQDKLKDLLKEYQYGSDKFNDVSGEIQDIDDEISSLIQSQNEWNKSILEIPVNNLTKVNEQLQNISNALGDTISEFDTAISTVTGVIDKQVQSINDLKDATSKEYENKIKPLQEELDLLKEKTEQENLQLAIEEAQADLEKAKQNTNNKVLFNGEWEYRTDIDEMKNAQEALDDAVYNKKVNDLEKQIDGLEEERDKLLEGYDEQIEKLDKIKDRWSSIASDIKLAADSLKANDLLGAGWENKVLTGNDDAIYNAMKDMYSSIYKQKEEYDKQIKATEQIADLMGQYVKHWLNGAVTYDQAMDAITLLVEKLQDGFSNLDYVDSLVGLNGGSNLSEVLANMQQSTNDSLSQLKEYLGTVQSNKDLFDKYTSTWEDMKKNIEREIEALEKAAKAMEENAKYSSNSSHSSGGSSDGGGSSSGSSGKGPNVNDDSYVASGPGHTESGYQNAVNSGQTIRKYHSGVKAGYVGGSSSGKESQFAFVNQFLTKPLEETELPIIAQKGELVMTSEQQKRMIENIEYLQSKLKENPQYIPFLNREVVSDSIARKVGVNKLNFDKLQINKTETNDNRVTFSGDIHVKADNPKEFSEAIKIGASKLVFERRDMKPNLKKTYIGGILRG